MVGRAYTMKEMKQIVDYLVEHRAYNEIRGRKMWMDLASSKVIDRTWQSLKETFLKRVLPDIHNPYYKLTVEQISSFRQEVDIAAKNRSRLEIHTISDDSSTSDNQRAIKQDIEKEDKKTGEETCSKIQNRTRSSTDTLVLENCYETAEDVRKDLESPTKSENAQKSLRDFITYSEPLTPMLQEVLHDFTSDDEPQMQIVEEPEAAITNEEHAKSKSPETFRESQSYTKKTGNNADDDDRNKIEHPSKIKSLKLKKTHKGTWENKEPVNVVSTTVQERETNNNESDIVFTCKENTVDPKIIIAEKSIVPDKINSISTTDTPLPNNQEELANKPNQTRTSTESSNSEFLEPRKKKKDKSRKRSHSQSSLERKKKKRDTKQTPSVTPEPGKDTQTFDSHPQATSLQKELCNNTLNTQLNTNDQTDDTNITPNVVVKSSMSGRNEGTSQEAGPSGVSPADINPCLKSVSLYEEQFSQLKYSDSNEDASADNDTQVKNNGNDNNCEPENDDKNKNGTNNSKETVSHELKGTTVVNNEGQQTTSKNCGFDDVLLLKSHSETSSEQREPPRKRPFADRIQKSKEMVLANMFGFTSGGATYKKASTNTSSRRFLQRQKIIPRNQSIDAGSSDDYTTASDSEDTPPSNGRHNGHSRRFRKPPSYDILSHDDSLFVMGRKKIYPLMLRANGGVHYTCGPEDKDAERADSYWKAKYLEERKKRAEETIRADELARLLQKAKEDVIPRESTSPILQTKQSLTTIINKPQPKESKEIVPAEPNSRPDDKIKIKFNRNKDVQVELEGQWTNINPIFERMVELFNSNDNKTASTSIQHEAETKAQNEKDVPVQDETAKKQNAQSLNAKPKRTPQRKSNTKEKTSIVIKDSEEPTADDSNKKLEEPVVLSSGKSTPSVIESDLHTKVDKIEREIFEKIVEIDKTEKSSNENETHNDAYVTKRKPGRPRKISTTARSSASLDTVPQKRTSSTENIPKKVRSSSTESAAKKARTSSVGAQVDIPEEEKEDESNAGTSKRSIRAPKKSRTSSVGAVVDIPEEEKEDESDAGTSKRSIRTPKKYGSESNLIIEGRRTKTKSQLSLPKPNEDKKADDVSIPEDDNVRYKFPAKTKKLTKYNIKRSSSNEPSLTSPDVSSRHSESYPSYQDSDITPPNITKRRKRMSTVNLVCKKGFNKRVKRKSCPYLADDDSCSTNESQSQKSAAAPNVSQTLNSEVYRSDSYQILMPKPKKHCPLDKIDENTLPNETEINKNTSYNLTSSSNINNEYYVASDELLGFKNSEANSSNASFPLSPELSIVENLSVSKDLISSSVEAPTINETQRNNEEQPTASPNQYLISEVDVSMPLMGQECEIQTQNKIKSRNRRTTFSESFPQEQYSSESLDQRLRDLLLESAKKIAQGKTETNNNESIMEVDNVVGSIKKAAIKKRHSSTPRKRKTVQRSKTPNVDPVIEEHTESCSQSGRKSCPPVICVIPCEESSVKVGVNAKPERGRKKKDIIKVKILRPRSNSRSKERIHNSRISVCTDSGINGTESGSSEGCQCCDITTELIHNHSDTCLHMDDCVGDSVEIVEDTTRSIISINSNSISFEAQSDKTNASKDNKEFVTPETLCSNARDATSLNSAIKLTESDADEIATVYHTPPSGESLNSMITDDLSDESKHSSHTKWYLLSEEDTNFADARSRSHSSASVKSNLNKIFTLCAVPNLSTISERSKENDTKTIINTDTEPDTVSQSLFDLEF